MAKFQTTIKCVSVLFERLIFDFGYENGEFGKGKVRYKCKGKVPLYGGIIRN